MNIIGRLTKSLVNSPFCLTNTSLVRFSKFFAERDLEEITQYTVSKYYNKKYRNLLDSWNKPMLKKQKRKERIRVIKANKKQPEPENEKFVVHNEAVGIKYPPTAHEKFCVVQVDNFQYKLTQDCVLILDCKSTHEINKEILFDKVLLFATPTYTLLGRPTLGSVRVRGIVESISDSQKTIVFKKKRRKQYKKSFGSRGTLTTCRITKIDHLIQQSKESISKATSLL